jgi:hypothetical protein
MWGAPLAARNCGLLLGLDAFGHDAQAQVAAIARIERTIAVPSASFGVSRMKLLSIFSSYSGMRFR